MNLSFFEMGGYAYYVWSAYGCVLGFLFLQWFLPWRKWRNFLRKQKSTT